MKWYQKLYMGIVLLFLYAPIGMLIVFSFNNSKSRGAWGGFTLDWYKKLLSSADIMEALSNTVSVALIAAAVATIVGTVAALGIYEMRKPARSLVLNVSYLPIINPDIVTGVSLMLLFVFLKMELGYGTMLLAHIAFDIPYVIFSVLPRLQGMDNSVYEAAMDLGASPAQAIWKVVLPEIMPGVITGAILAFTLSIDDFVISFFTTRSVENLSIYIYSSARRGIDPTIYALMAIMFVVVLALMSVAGSRLMGGKPKTGTQERKRV